VATATTFLGERDLHASLDARWSDDLDRLATQVDRGRLFSREDREHVHAVKSVVDLGAEDLPDLRA